MGAPSDANTKIGALISKEHMVKVTGYIELAIKENAIVQCGYGVDELLLPGEMAQVRFVQVLVLKVWLCHSVQNIFMCNRGAIMKPRFYLHFLRCFSLSHFCDACDYSGQNFCVKPRCGYRVLAMNNGMSTEMI